MNKRQPNNFILQEMDRKERNTPDSEDFQTIIGEGTHFNGVLTFDGSMHIDGNLEGKIISNGNLFVGNKSVIKADIKISYITVGGRICGNIIATRRLVILSDAEVCGNIQSPILRIEEGAKFQGNCDMRLDTEKIKPISYSKVKNIKRAKLYLERP